jgi:hypothetical protein
MLAVSRFVLRHKLLVLAFWLAVLAAGAAAAGGLSSRLSRQVALPGAAGYEANHQILRLYGNGGDGYPEVVVATLPPGDTAASAAGRRALGRAFGAVAAIGGLRVADYASTGDRTFLTSDPRVSYGLVFTPYAGEGAPSLAPHITSAMLPALPAGGRVQVTGMNELKSGGQAKQSLGVLAETLTAAAAALAVLVFVFGSALAIVPLLMAAVAIPASFLAVYGLTEITSVFFIVQYLVALIGLGVAIDYSLLLVTRWREELAAGHDGEEAVSRAMATAGRSIAFSGLTVAIGLLVLIVVRCRWCAASRWAGSSSPPPASLSPPPASGAARHGRPAHGLAPAQAASPRQPGMDRLGAAGGPPQMVRRPGSARHPRRARRRRSRDQGRPALGRRARHHQPGRAGPAHPGTGWGPRRGPRPHRGPRALQRRPRRPRRPREAAGSAARRAHRRRSCRPGLAPRRDRAGQHPACRRALRPSGRGHAGPGATRRGGRARSAGRRAGCATAR